MAKAKTSLVVTDGNELLSISEVNDMLCICTWLLPYFSSLENRDTNKAERIWTFFCFHSHSHYCFRFPAVPLTLNPISICFTLQGEPEQAWFSLYMSLQSITVTSIMPANQWKLSACQ